MDEEEAKTGAIDVQELDTIVRRAGAAHRKLVDFRSMRAALPRALLVVNKCEKGRRFSTRCEAVVLLAREGHDLERGRLGGHEELTRLCNGHVLGEISLINSDSHTARTLNHSGDIRGEGDAPNLRLRLHQYACVDHRRLDHRNIAMFVEVIDDQASKNIYMALEYMQHKLMDEVTHYDIKNEHPRGRRERGRDHRLAWELDALGCQGLVGNHGARGFPDGRYPHANSAMRRDHVFEDSERTNEPLKSVVQRVLAKDLSQELKLNNCFDHD